MAKDLVFVHDYFCFIVYKYNELEPIALERILYHVSQNGSEEETEKEKTEFDKKKEVVITMGKEYIAKHLLNEEERFNPPQRKMPKLFPLEFNLIPLICFIALRLANYPVFPRDICHWIKLQVMPYFSTPSGSSTEGLYDISLYISSLISSRKDYLIKPMNIPSASWIRTSFKSFMKIYQIQGISEPSYIDQIIERVFLDCEIPYVLQEPCIRLYHSLSLVRQDYKVKPIDEVIKINQ